MNSYISFFDELNKKNIRYLICGGLAVNIHGIPRMTADIDLLLDFEIENIEKFEKVILSLSYLPLIPIRLTQLIDVNERLKLIKEKNIIAYSYQGADGKLLSVDVLIDTPISFEVLWINRATRKVGEHEVILVGIEDLIRLKKHSNRLQDKEDIINLSKFIYGKE